MEVLNKEVGTSRKEIIVNRSLEIKMNNGDIYFIREDNEGMMEITKEYSDDNSRININPRQSNQLCLF
jgi:hypothetical protein